jgi:uncharacterized protein (DUF169 family)
MTDWSQIEEQLTQELELDRPPVAVAFRDAAPSGVRKFMGEVPSSCTFWKLAASTPAGRSAFYTVPSDHYHCPIGSYTHSIDLPPERAHELSDVLGLMAKIGYVAMEEVPQIPRWPSAPKFIVYARLGDAPMMPDVVVFALRADKAMLLHETARAAGVGSSLAPLPRPTCMAIPAAAGHGATVSTACIGNRIYTDLADSHLYVMVRGTDVAPILASLSTIKSANAQLTTYHQQRKPALTRADASA